MAYIIGNTTVIDNNAALGAVSGNSLNLANNANISGGGGVKSLTSSSNFADTDLGSTGAIAVCVGGGGGAARGNQSHVTASGGSGGTVVHAFALTAATNITATVGAAGNNREVGSNPNQRAPSGGSSSISYPTVQTHSAGGGTGGICVQNAYPGGSGAGLTGGGGSGSVNVGFSNIGRGSPRPPYQGPNSIGTGYVGILGL